MKKSNSIIKEILIHILGSLYALKADIVTFDELIYTYLKPSLIDEINKLLGSEAIKYDDFFELYEEILEIDGLDSVIGKEKYQNELNLLIKRVEKLIKKLDTDIYNLAPSIVTEGLSYMKLKKEFKEFNLQ